MGTFRPPSVFHTMGNSLMRVSLVRAAAAMAMAQETGQMKLYPQLQREREVGDGVFNYQIMDVPLSVINYTYHLIAHSSKMRG